jgi:hypothetical protein
MYLVKKNKSAPTLKLRDYILGATVLDIQGRKSGLFDLTLARNGKVYKIGVRASEEGYEAEDLRETTVSKPEEVKYVSFSYLMTSPSLLAVAAEPKAKLVLVFGPSRVGWRDTQTGRLWYLSKDKWQGAERAWEDQEKRKKLRKALLDQARKGVPWWETLGWVSADPDLDGVPVEDHGVLHPDSSAPSHGTHRSA